MKNERGKSGGREAKRLITVQRSQKNGSTKSVQVQTKERGRESVLHPEAVYKAHSDFAVVTQL